MSCILDPYEECSAPRTVLIEGEPGMGKTTYCKKVLPRCHIVTTARHETGKEVRKCCDTLLEIEGFTENHVKGFITKYFKERPDLAAKLSERMSRDKNLTEMAANPLNTALLCLLCEEFEGTLPENRAQLYLDMIECVLRRYRKKKGLSEKGEDLTNLYKPQLNHLGSVALNGLLNGKLDFNESELANHAKELTEFGFLSVQPGGSKLRQKLHYAFLHKSFQECFAAFFICSQIQSKEITLEELVSDPRYFVKLKEVLLFSCGILAMKCDEGVVALVKSLTNEVNKNAGSGTKVVLEAINECKREKSDFHSQLAKSFGTGLKLTNLNLSGIGFSDAGATSIAEAIEVNKTLTNLKLSRNGISDAGATSIAEAIKVNKTLTNLNLSFNCICDAGATSIAEAIKVNKTLTNLNLSYTRISDAGATSIAEAIKVNKTLTNLNLSDNGISDAGATSIADAIKVNKSLTNLKFSLNRIRDAGATSIAEAIKVNETLTNLNLSYTRIGHPGKVRIMATAISPFASTKETTNYARLCRLLVDVGSQVLRSTFDTIHPPATLHTVLGSTSVHYATLQSLYKGRKKVLNPTQWGKLYPTHAPVSSAAFDITLLTVLLRNICGLGPPANGWDRLPLATDISIADDIARVKYYRNTVYGHASQASVDDSSFSAYWQEIREALMRLGGAHLRAEIDNLEHNCMDPDIEEHYRQLMKQWKKDDDSIKDKLEEIERSFEKMIGEMVKMDSELKEVKEKLCTLTASVGESKDEGQLNYTVKVILLNRKFRRSQHGLGERSKTKYSFNENIGIEFGSMLEINRVRSTAFTSQIAFGQVIDMNHTLIPFSSEAPQFSMLHSSDFLLILLLLGIFDPSELINGIRQLYKTREGWLSPFPWCEEFQFFLGNIFTRLKVVRRKKTRGEITDVFVEMSSILDPYEDCSAPRTVLIEGEPGMGKTTYCKKYAYNWATNCGSTAFKVVLLLKCRDIHSDVWEAIDDQLLSLDIDEKVKRQFFQFMRENQSSILLILDGLDELPSGKLSMFSELIEGKVLPRCHIVATARHEAGKEVRKCCDALLQIEGFTEKHVKGFVTKYFKERTDLATKLSQRMSQDKNLREIAANPLNTALLCLLCEESEGTLPESRAQLYLDMVECVLRRYRKKRDYWKR
ncbi:unnamed protein product [Pocillopora meandrina]|uniref:NACHT domain-containing protein n=1 Tax=Pocillopora meandrina TaxID=46732 RepID=A0AAU9XUA9_9CNID|nr:unnamed protein product [Pocillopora meandrina]